ncbi:MAG: penicillin-binding protein 1C [Alphaproteobacteria bacterium]
MRRLRAIGLAVAGLASALVLAGFLLDRAFPPDLARYRDVSRSVEAADGSLLRVFATGDGLIRLPVTAEEVDTRYLRYLVAYEDRRFEAHPGVDPLALGRAVAQAIGRGHAVSGASTLTMQVARLLEPRPRSFGAKLIEMWRALQLEWRYDKAEILDIYLTLAPFGGNLEGVRAASLAYFGKEPRVLTEAEAALLVALPQAPSRVRPDRASEAAVAARAKVLGRLVAAHEIDAETARIAAATPVLGHREPLPFLAPHLAQRLAAAKPGETRLRSFIEPAVQAALERSVKDQLGVVDAHANIAALVVETETGKVVGHVGSAAFFSTRRAGQIDLTVARRSPGSALKPVLYAMAFDERRAHPGTILADVRQRFGAYAPSNFDGEFSGEVTARFALQRSLNVPAVDVLEAIGPRRLLARLGEVGVEPDLPVGDDGPGLALALGGAAVSLEDLVTLYAGLARGGEVRTLRFEPGAPEAEGMRLVGAEAAAEIADVLRGAPRPTVRGAADAGQVAFKTGTSYGYRDAWAIGFDRRHTVGVWVGRPDGTPMPGVTGLSAAAPLLFRIFDGLPGGGARSLSIAADPAGAPPPNLTRLSSKTSDGSALGLRFPLDGALLMIEYDDQNLPLLVEGGRRPFTWLVDGTPIVVGKGSRRASWRPPGPGFYVISVVDVTGETVRARVEVALSSKNP